MTVSERSHVFTDEGNCGQGHTWCQPIPDVHVPTSLMRGGEAAETPTALSCCRNPS